MNRRIIIIIAVLSLCAWASQTRMTTFGVGDYLDDVVNIGVYPHHIAAYANYLYGDITSDLADYGIAITPDRKYGVLACWQTMQRGKGFHLGYARSIARFDVGISGSPVKDHYQYAIGVGRAYFNRRFDLAFTFNDEETNTWYDLNIRLSKRKGDFVSVLKYTLHYVTESAEYNQHRIGLLLQRLVLNDGFVYLAGEYDLSRGDFEHDRLNVFAGFELPLSKIFVLRAGAWETMSNGNESPVWNIEPGLSLRIREFSIDFHINKERFYNKDVTLIQSVGLDLNFGRF